MQQARIQLDARMLPGKSVYVNYSMK